MGTNHLGHFALTCLLGDRINDRVVSVTSMNHMFSRMHLDDLNWRTRPYSKWAAYGESKLAVMLFVQELARRGVRAIRNRPRFDEHRNRTGQHGVPGLGPRHRRSFRSSIPHTPSRRPGRASGGDDRPAAGHLSGALVSTSSADRRSPRCAEKARDPEMAGRLWELSARADGCDWPTGSR